MLTTDVAIGIFAVIGLLLGGGVFYLLRKTKYQFGGFVVVAGLTVFVYNVLIPHVYILDDELENRYEERIAIFPSSFTFKNGETAEVPVKGSAIIINNNDDRRVFKVVYYSTGTARTPTSQWIQPYSVTATTHSVDLVYKEPPSSVRTKGSSASRGVILDRR